MREIARKHVRIRHGAQAGFSMIEMMVVVGLMGVVTGIAVLQIGTTRQALKGDGAMRTVLAQVNQAREMAITQRRNIRLVFTIPNVVSIYREEVPTPVSGIITTTQLQTVPFEGGLQFNKVSGVDIDTPDYGTALPAGNPLAFNGATEYKFTPQGTFVDQDGNIMNATVFVAYPGDKVSARAVAIFGSTGRVRGYRWDGRAWQRV